MVLVLALFGALGCSDTKSERCKKVCDREDKCVRELDNEQRKMDSGECATVCTALERDSEGKKIVNAHIACVDAARSCEAVLACE